MEKSIPHKVKEVISEEQINSDLKHYREAALNLKGITDAVIIGRSDIFIDPRGPLKCSIPKCWSYGRCANCPPHSLKAEETQKIVDLYHHAIFIKSELKSDVLAGPEVAKSMVAHGSEENAPDEKSVEGAKATINIIKAVSKLEAMAFYDGHYYATGFSAGTCRVTLCWKYPDCAVLSGEKCRHVYLSRPSMESVGFNVFKMATRVGWDIYTIGATVSPEDVPHALLMGIVLVT
jgi:predicted metal-binding protein